MRIAVAFAREASNSPTSRLCSACVEVLGVTGAGITIMGSGQAGPVCISNSRIAALEDLQFTLGEGPCQDAYHSGRPVHAPRLDLSRATRWPAFVELAQASGIGAVFAYPLTTNGAKVGVLTLYQERSGELSVEQDESSAALADVLSETVLSVQDGAPAGVLAPMLEDAVMYRSEIYQAAGMVSVQLSVPVAEALARIRAFAFANDQALDDVAGDIVARRTRLADDRHETGEAL